MSHNAYSEWALVDRIVLSATSGVVAFKTGGNGAQNYPVSGNADKGFKVTWDILGNATTGVTATARLNGGTTNQTMDRMAGTGAGGFAASTNTGMGFPCNAGTAASRHVGEWVIETAITGSTRLSNMVRGQFGTTLQIEQDLGKYNDSSTDITSVEFNINTGDGTGTIWLYVKCPQQASLIL